MSIWNFIKGFSPSEKWGKASEMNGFTLMLMSALREQIREHDPEATVSVHAGFATEGHSSDPPSQHYEGNAVDFHFKTVLPYPVQITFMLDVLEELQVANRVGFGIYPDWNSPGFHVDCRGKLARWGYIDKIIYFGDAKFKQVVRYANAKFAA